MPEPSRQLSQELAPRSGGVRTVPIRRLYGSHLLAQFGDRLWQFAVPILFITIWTDTLLPSAVFQFLLTFVRILFVPAVGRRVDTTDRLQLVGYGTFGQNICQFISGALLYYLYIRVDEKQTSFGDDVIDVCLFGTLVLVGIVGDLFNIAGKIGVEKDWVVVIVDEELRRGDPIVREDRLGDLNAKLRRIDLMCKIIAPLSYGVVVGFVEKGYWEVTVGTGIVCAWSVLSTAPIYFAWRAVYFEYEDLQIKKPGKKQNPFSVLLNGSKNYVRHSIFAPSLAFCCLFFTVLSDHHPLSTAFLKMDGVSNAVLGAARGGGALTGLIGTMIFPRLRNCTGLVSAAIIEAWLFALVVVPISLLYIVGNVGHLLRAYLLLGAIVLSRCFLWGFDLSNVQMLQQMVEEGVRGEMNGMQSATCNVMELAMATLSLFCTSRQNFHILVFASGGGVTIAAIILSCWGAFSSRSSPDAAPIQVAA
jgi:iron-regulated transporter 1